MIDPNKPMRFTDKGDTRKVTFIGKMPNGDIVATSTDSAGPNGLPWAAPLVFDRLTGKAKVKDGGLGCALVIENAPMRSSGFYAMDRTGYPVGARGITTLDGAKLEYNHPFFVEVVTIDGVPTEAKIHAR